MVRLLQVFLVFIIGISISSPCCAGIKIGGKKAETRAQQKARNNIDEMVSAAESFLQVEDSFDRAIKILKEAYFQSNQDNYTIGIIRAQTYWPMDIYIWSTIPTQRLSTT